MLERSRRFLSPRAACVLAAFTAGCAATGTAVAPIDPAAQSAGVEQLKNGVIAQRRGLRLRVRGGHAGALQHLRHFWLGQRLGQNLPRLGRFNVHRGVMMDAPVKQQPLVKSAQAAQLARGRTLVDAVDAQVFQKSSHVLLRGGQKYAMSTFNKLREGLQVAVIRFASERT